ncbi:helicase HerA-like domain-containing protein [Microbulbifer pacificus]|uniref:Helicase HerA-like domain-containing protein n=1 Tax=Microbulbifer pacificus TaxID=407164 RepID=A0AAU0N121_9GAMM|nr:helicase HerA-like domain-containing protein [Microbulbifer pacificus]WOX05344.1 helicase HerA-like domain-containing protein [Microbulbifer pacificus]
MPLQPNLSQPIPLGKDKLTEATPGQSNTGQLLPQMLNRHGLICGATGTGKTVTLRYLAEQLSARDIATLVTDLKGDLSGLGAAGGDSHKVRERLPLFDLDEGYFHAFPLTLWGAGGLPMRTTPSELGPELIGRMLQLNDNQQGLMQLLFRIADRQGLLLLDWKDLLALIDYADQKRKALLEEFGTISPASLGAIKRKYLALESQGADALFGEPALDLPDLMQNNCIHLLDASDMQPSVYGILLLWLLAELYENLPEVGDRQLRLVLFFDEAHLLFDDLPKNLCGQVEQIVKLIRSRGVGIFFITQNPLDIPEDILAQLGNRVQHALRAYTPNEQRALKAAANSFRANPEIDTAQAIGELGVGEALVSCLDENGVPQPVSRLLIYPPASRLTPLDDRERKALLQDNPWRSKYSQQLDRESAYEQLQQRRAQAEPPAPPTKKPTAASRKPSALEKSFDKMATSFGRQIGRELMRGIMGALTGGKR